jgi:uncharacterized protein DUF1549/uncharacterized protein DUF1553
MYRLSLWLVTGVLSLSAFAAEAAPAKRAGKVSKPPAKAAQLPVTKLSILPAEIQLDGPKAGQHLLVMGTLADGSQLDLTEKARLVSSAPKLAPISGSRVAARGDGKAVVTASYGKLSARAAVSVKNAAQPLSYSFQNDVVPVLARLGCSQGTCHGANSGKGGFKLSLRGYAPELDFLTLTRQQGGRRISREAPEQSLVLRKSLLEVPHAGGKRMEKGSGEYYTLLGWLLQGAPGVDEKDPKLVSLTAAPGARVYRKVQEQRLLIRAAFSDGHTEDVTDRAVYRSNDAGIAEVSEDGKITVLSPGSTAVQAKYMDQLAVVRVTLPYPQKINPAAFQKPNNYVDEAVYARLRELNLEPSGLCTDEEFIRRVYIDAIGTLPAPDEVRRFLDSKDPDRRSQLIDEVLKRPEYGSIWALKISDVSMVRREHMQRKNTVALNQWLTEQFQQNRPWDQLVTDLVTATGSIEENPATLWWASRQQTRPNGRGWVRHYELTGEIVAQVFLGQRIQCTKCHNHPTEKYTQDDYYRFAAIFAQVNGDGRADPVPERFLPNDRGEVRHPRTGQAVTPAALDRSELNAQAGEDRRVKFAQWLTGTGREMFSRSAVNRIWARLFGVGIVDPVDDLRSTNPPRNEQLMDALAKELIAHRYDMKNVMGTIMRSRTYQASSVATPANKIDTQFFSHYPVRRIQGEELLDAIAQVTGVPDRFASYPLGTRAIELSDTELPSLALDTFGRPTRVTPCECDRSMAPSLSQALDLFNGETLQNKLKNGEGTVAQLVKSGKPDREIVEELFLSALARRPTQKELDDVLKVVPQAPSREEAMQDVLWALINSKEFMFNH